jgi:hypothetical protein
MKIKIYHRMKKSVYKSGMLLAAATFLLSCSLMAQEITKEYHKEFKTAKTTTLEISNRYGDVVIESWDKDQVVIDVKVTIETPDKSKAEKLMSYIDIQFTEDINLIGAKTVIDDKFNFSGWGSNRRFKIDYAVKMPSVMTLTLSNRYGNTDIDVLKGLVNIDIKYGNFTADKLLRGNEKPLSKISIAYGKGSIDEAGWLDIYIRYSKPVEISRSTALLIDSRYSTLRIDETSSIVGDSKYDTYEIGKINNLILISGYTSTSVGTLTKKLSFNGSYSSFNVDDIPAGFESLDVEVKYMTTRLGISESASYKLDGYASYGGIKFNEDNFRHEKRIIENNSTTLTGTVGKDSSPVSTVKVSSSYGQVKLY